MSDEEFLALTPTRAAVQLAKLSGAEYQRRLALYASSHGVSTFEVGDLVKRARADPQFEVSSEADQLDLEHGKRRATAAKQKAVAASVQHEPDSGDMSWLPMSMIVVGLLVMLGSFFFDVGVETGYGDVANLDAVSVRQMLTLVGGFVFTSGWIALSADRIVQRLKAATK